MKHKFVIFTDCHEYAPHEIADLPQLRRYSDSWKKVYLGDNVDIKGCLKKVLHYAHSRLAHLWNMDWAHFVLGNHELEFFKNQFSADQESKILFTHGHQVFWDQKKIEKWANKKPGRGKFMRGLSWVYSHWRMIWKPKIKDIHMERAIERARQFGCNVVITGHRHPKKPIYRTQDGVTLVTLPRGKNIVETDGKGFFSFENNGNVTLVTFP